MSSFNYDAYASDLRLIIAAPEEMKQSLDQLKRKMESTKSSEEQKTRALRSQLIQTKESVSRQYDEIRQALESINLHVLPAQQRPVPSQLVTADTLKAQNEIAKQIKTQISNYHEQAHNEAQRFRAQQEAKARAAEEARKKAEMEAKALEEKRVKEQQQEELMRKLQDEKERKQKEEFRKKISQWIPVGIILIIILIVLLNK